MKYHTRSCTVIINIGQSFQCVVFNSAPVAHFGKRSEDHPWHSGQNRTDIAEFGSIPTKIRFIVAQLYREIALMD